MRHALTAEPPLIMPLLRTFNFAIAHSPYHFFVLPETVTLVRVPLETLSSAPL